MVRVGLAELVNHKVGLESKLSAPSSTLFTAPSLLCFLLKQNIQWIAHAKCSINVQDLIDMTIKEMK